MYQLPKCPCLYFLLAIEFYLRVLFPCQYPLSILLGLRQTAPDTVFKNLLYFQSLPSNISSSFSENDVITFFANSYPLIYNNTPSKLTMTSRHHKAHSKV